MSQKLTKSLAELDAAADELLAKSKAAEDNQADDSKDVAPEEVSDSATPESEGAENADADKEEKKEETPEEGEEPVEKSEDVDDLEKCDNPNGDIKKSEDTAGEESEPSEPEEGAGEGEEEKSAEDIEKSIKDDFEAEEPIKKSMESSEFLASVVDIIAKSMGDVQYDVQSQGREQSAATEILAKSIGAVMQTNQSLKADNERLTRRINKLEKSITQGFEKVMDSLDEISAQPAHMRKSMASVSVHDRNFDRSLNGQQTVGGFESLSKSQVLTVLNNELYAGNQNVTPQDIISYESGAPLRHDLQSLVESKCK